MIYIVRHGQTDWNIEHRIQGQSDIPLNDTGRKQADILSNKIKSLNINRIISSDLSRTMETAQIANQHTHFPIQSDRRLREFNYGDLEGTLGLSHPPELWDMFDHMPEKFNAESIPDIYNRIKSFFEILDVRENVLLVTHGGAIRMMMYYVEHPSELNLDEFLELARSKTIPNTAIFQWNGQLFSPIVEMG